MSPSLRLCGFISHLLERQSLFGRPLTSYGYFSPRFSLGPLGPWGRFFFFVLPWFLFSARAFSFVVPQSSPWNFAHALKAASLFAF